MISLSASAKERPEVRIHGGFTLRATADCLADTSWLVLSNELDDTITIFLPFELAAAIAVAINKEVDNYDKGRTQA